MEDVLLIDSADQKLTSTQVPMNSRFSIVMEGFTNYELKDSKAFPGMSLQVTDKQGKAVMYEADLFAASEGYSAQDASVLRATATVGSLMENSQGYHCKVREFDKNRAEWEVVCEPDFTVQ